MYCINLESYDPYFNLAIEELLLKSTDEEYMILGINNPSVIIGKHQAGHREVNTRFVIENNIPVIRRISGGGTVFHDRGNLNFSFIRQSEAGRQVDFRKYTQPVIAFLKSCGVEAKFEGKNDIRVDGFKISGNSEHVYHNRVLHHGTLLFSTSMEMLRSSLREDSSCYISRAVMSNPSSVLNLAGKLNHFQDINEFKSEMMNYFLKNFSGYVPFNLSPSQIIKAESIAESKYKSWEWNWAYGPEYTFKNTFKINRMLHSCSLFIIDGIIRESTITGSEKISSASKKLIGCRHMVDNIRDFFRNENIVLNEEEIYNFF